MSGFLLGGSVSSLPSSLPASFVRSLVLGVSAAWRPAVFNVGCAAGADAFFISACLASFAPLAVFAASPSPRGFWPRACSPRSVFAASSAGAPVSWSPPGLPPAAALAARSSRAVAASSAGLFLVGAPASRGSFRSASLLLGRGCPVWVVCVGFPPARLPFPFSLVSSVPAPFGPVSVVRLAAQGVLPLPA